MEREHWIAVGGLLAIVSIRVSQIPTVRRMVKLLCDSGRFLAKPGHLWIPGICAAGQVLNELQTIRWVLQHSDMVVETEFEIGGLPAPLSGKPLWQSWPSMVSGLIESGLIVAGVMAVLFLLFRHRIRSSIRTSDLDAEPIPQLEWVIIWGYALFSLVAAIVMIPISMRRIEPTAPSIMSSIPFQLGWSGIIMSVVCFAFVGATYLQCGIIGTIMRKFRGESVRWTDLFVVDRSSVIWVLVVQFVVIMVLGSLPAGLSIIFLLLDSAGMGMFGTLIQYFYIYSIVEAFNYLSAVPRLVFFLVPVLIVTQQLSLWPAIKAAMSAWRRHGIDLLILLLMAPIPAIGLKIIHHKLMAIWFEMHLAYVVAWHVAAAFLMGCLAAVWLVATVRLVEQWRVEDEEPRTRDDHINRR